MQINSFVSTRKCFTQERFTKQQKYPNKAITRVSFLMAEININCPSNNSTTFFSGHISIMDLWNFEEI